MQQVTLCSIFCAVAPPPGLRLPLAVIPKLAVVGCDIHLLLYSLMFISFNGIIIHIHPPSLVQMLGECCMDCQNLISLNVGLFAYHLQYEVHQTSRRIGKVLNFHTK